MKEEIEWIFSGVGMTLLAGVASLLWGWRKKRSNRIEAVYLKYDSIYKRDGLRLKCLLSSGIHTLKTDREIEEFFEKVMTIEPNHPLRKWDSRVQKVGYKKFFDYVFKKGQSLGKHNIESYISEFE